MNDLPLSIFFIFAGLYLIYSVIHNYSNYKILSVSGNRDLFFSKTDAKNIKRIIEKRNDYFRETYFLNMEKYDATTKIYTANWLYKECAVTEAEILKLDGFFYNAETGKFDYSEKRNEAINEAEI